MTNQMKVIIILVYPTGSLASVWNFAKACERCVERSCVVLLIIQIDDSLFTDLLYCF